MVSVLCEEIIADRERLAKGNDKHLRNAKTVRSHLRRFAAAFRKPLDMIRLAELEQYLLRFNAPKTRDNQRISIVVLFNYARNHGHLPLDKKHAANFIPHPKKGTLKRVRKMRPYTPEEFLRILATASERVIPFLTVGAFAGPRTAERERMPWRCWNSAKLRLVLDAVITKGTRTRQIAIEPNLAEWLDTFAGVPTDSIQPRSDLHKVIGPIIDKAGAPRQHNGLRVSYIAYHVERFENLPLTSKHCGHSVQMLEDNYLQRADAEEWFKITPSSVIAFAKRDGLPVPSWHHRLPSAVPTALAA